MTAPAGLSNASPLGADHPRPRSYTAGFADQLGERKLAFDSAAGTSIEVLQFKKEFSESAAFEAALRSRVEEVSHVQHSSLAAILSVERDEEHGLSLVSKHTSGRRVSELVPKAHGPAFALELIRLVTPALAALQRSGDGVAHGALSADRIIVTRDGRLVVVEHVLGSAIDALKFSRSQLTALGFVVPEGSDSVRLDGRSDMLQLGFIALSLLLGRQLDPADYPSKVSSLFDEFVQSSRSPILAAKMRGWLERAMQLSPRPFASAREAQDAFADLPDDVDVRLADPSLLTIPSDARPTPAAPAKPQRDRVPEAKPVEHVAAHQHEHEHDAVEVIAMPAKSSFWGLSRVAVGIIGVLGLLAAGQAVALFALPYARPASEVIEIRPAGVDPAAASGTAALIPPVAPVVQTPVPTPAASAPVSAPTSNETAAAAAAPVAGPRFGGMTVSSAIDLQVIKEGRVVGSTAGPIALNEGPHNLEFVNETLGFRLQQGVSVKSGQMTSVKIAVPNGRISINAVPWAEVTIDGTPRGETPIANLSLPIGSHEIVFTHPQFGVRKQTVIVKVDGLLRVTQPFQQDFKH